MDKASSPRALGDGKIIPAVGLGLYYTPPGDDTYNIVSEALKLGYRYVRLLFSRSHPVLLACGQSKLCSRARTHHLESQAF